MLRSNDTEDAQSVNWLTDAYFQSLSQEKAAALDQLHNATNWGITLATTALIIVLSRQQFPDIISLYTLLITFIIVNHFFTRTLKGYINVIRWSLLQRVITGIRSQSDTSNRDREGSHLKELVGQYHLNWLLPLKRTDVFTKGLFELGYGYILVGIIGTAAYVVYVTPIGQIEVIFIFLSLVIAIFEHTLLLRSPYMRKSAVNQDARRLR